MKCPLLFFVLSVTFKHWIQKVNIQYNILYNIQYNILYAWKEECGDISIYFELSFPIGGVVSLDLCSIVSKVMLG